MLVVVGIVLVTVLVRVARVAHGRWGWGTVTIVARCQGCRHRCSRCRGLRRRGCLVPECLNTISIQ